MLIYVYTCCKCFKSFMDATHRYFTFPFVWPHSSHGDVWAGWCRGGVEVTGIRVRPLARCSPPKRAGYSLTHLSFLLSILFLTLPPLFFFIFLFPLLSFRSQFHLIPHYPLIILYFYKDTHSSEILTIQIQGNY